MVEASVEAEEEEGVGRRALQKWLQDRGVGTRRGVQALIAAGEVTVGGEVVTRFAEPVPWGAEVRVGGAPVGDVAPPLVLVMYKPRAHVTKLEDESAELPGLRRYLPAEVPFVFPVGRLDVNSEGALLFTNDGELAHRVLHPRWELTKWYAVKLRGHVAEDDPALERMRAGMRVDADTFLPAEVEVGEARSRATWVHMVLREGKHREVRRMCAAGGFQVVKLRRLAVGPVELGPLTPRCVRPLEQGERDALYRAVGLEPPPGAPPLLAEWPEIEARVRAVKAASAE